MLVIISAVAFIFAFVSCILAGIAIDNQQEGEALFHVLFALVCTGAGITIGIASVLRP